MKRETTKKAVVLSVAGSDSSGGAGIQADIKTISALGGYAATAITAVTVQNTLGVHDVYPIPPEVVRGQMEVVIEDMHPDAIKIGMIGSENIMNEIVFLLQKYSSRNVVYDPVMFSTSGHQLMGNEAIKTVSEKLFPWVELVTPNLYEAGVLLQKPIQTISEMEDATFELYEKYKCAFLIKGGHLKGSEMCDVLYDGKELNLLVTQRIHTQNLHGTGCTLSSAIATFLAKGDSLFEAVSLAKGYVANAIEAGKDLHLGQGNGPLWHYFSTPAKVQPEDAEEETDTKA